MGPGDKISIILFFILAGLFFIFVLRVTIGFFARKEPEHRPALTERKWVRIAAIIAAGLVILAIIDAFLIEPDWVVEEHMTFASRKVSRKIRIAHISDLHTEGFGRRHEKALDIIKGAEPDVILLTGDYLNGSRMKYLPELRQFVSQLQAPYGVYAIEGNFEYTQKPWELFNELGITVLEDEAAFIKDLGITVCGLRCEWNLKHSQKRLLEETAAQYPASYLVLLSHYPNHIVEPEAACTDLYLCGHTHGGQVRLPLWGAVVTLSKTGKQYECGHYTRKNMEIYVNRGLGMEGGAVPRVRFLCRPEVAIIDICPDSP